MFKDTLSNGRSGHASSVAHSEACIGLILPCHTNEIKSAARRERSWGSFTSCWRSVAFTVSRLELQAALLVPFLFRASFYED